MSSKALSESGPVAYSVNLTDGKRQIGSNSLRWHATGPLHDHALSKLPVAKLLIAARLVIAQHLRF